MMPNQAFSGGLSVMGATGLGLLGLFGARRRRRNGVGVGVFAVAFASSLAQGCCDPAVSTDTSVGGDSSTTNEGGSAESTGEPALPQWALGAFSSESDKVGMSFTGNLYWWDNIEITTGGALFYDLYSCSERIERLEFRWTLADDGQSLSVQTEPPADVFIWGNGKEVSEVIIEAGESCDAIVSRAFRVETMTWSEGDHLRGNVCATTAPGVDSCTFTFEWCDGAPPPPCE
jgi:MYXO-CTERM domain-containing protein